MLLLLFKTQLHVTTTAEYNDIKYDEAITESQCKPDS